MLHVLNGDSTYASLKTLQLPGRALVWPDLATEGPLGHDVDERGRWLEAEAGIPAKAYAESMRAFWRDLASVPRSEEVVLWFEEDLFCQLPLCELLSRKPDGANWTVVCHDEKLGPAPPDLLARFYDERRAADAELADLSTRAWRAACASDARAVADLVERGDFAAWPRLRDALRLHLARFPDERGLGNVDRLVLDAVAARDALPFDELWRAVSATPLASAYGLADMEAALFLWRLSRAGLVTLGDAAPRSMRVGALASARRWDVRATRTGRAVLAGEAKANLPARWIGGAYLS